MTAQTEFAAGNGFTLEPTEAAVLAAVLEEIPSAAFVLWADGRIACVNRLGHSARELAPDSIDSGLLESLGGRSEAYRVTRILAPGSPRHFLAVQAGGEVDPGPRVADAAARFGFTPRQAQVVGLLALGRSNKAIGNELGCAEATVEIHVTALLGKSGCGSRLELMSRVWSGPLGRARAGDAWRRRPMARDAASSSQRWGRS